MKRAYQAALVAVLAVTGFAAHAERQGVEVMIGGSPHLDACQMQGVVAGLGPRRAGDPKSGFLSVRSGPGGAKYFEIDQVFNGDKLIICGQSGPWLAVIFPFRDRQNFQHCYSQVNVNLATRQPYTGNCQSGWVHKSYVRITAG